jgi:hypothetical protein
MPTTLIVRNRLVTTKVFFFYLLNPGNIQTRREPYGKNSSFQVGGSTDPIMRMFLENILIE